MSTGPAEEINDEKFGEENDARSAIATIIPACLLSVAILISGVHYNVAQAKSRTAAAVACGQELKKQCSGVTVKANNMLECLQTAQVSTKCAALAHHVVRMCERDAQCSVAKASLRVKATFLDV